MCIFAYSHICGSPFIQLLMYQKQWLYQYFLFQYNTKVFTLTLFLTPSLITLYVLFTQSYHIHFIFEKSYICKLEHNNTCNQLCVCVCRERESNSALLFFNYFCWFLSAWILSQWLELTYLPLFISRAICPISCWTVFIHFGDMWNMIMTLRGRLQTCSSECLCSLFSLSCFILFFLSHPTHLLWVNNLISL